jgi:hypothetical protein
VLAKEGAMLKAISLTFVAVMWLGSLSAVCSSADSGQDQKKTPEAKAKTNSVATMTGCIDEQEGRYVLLNPESRALVANLEAEGFPTEGFAKHLGHTVTVRGTSSSAGTQPIFKVRLIETVNESCAPAKK